MSTQRTHAFRVITATDLGGSVRVNHRRSSRFDCESVGKEIAPGSPDKI
jgi:hypothetical protein